MRLSWEKDLQDDKKLHLYLDKQYWKTVHRSIFRRPKQILPTFETLEAYEQAFPEIEQRQAKTYTLYLLCRKAYLSTEIRKRLEEKLVSKNSSQFVIEELSQLGYIDDAAYLKSFIESQLRKKKGPKWIEGKLWQKGVSPQEITQALAQYAGKPLQEDGIAALLERRYKKQDLSDYSVRQKATAFLMRRGYCWDDIQNALSKQNT